MAIRHRVTCPECGYVTFVKIGSTFKVPDEYVRQCKHPPEKRSTKEPRAEGADCPYLIAEVERVVYGRT
jgi:hypothetical protein